MGRARSERGRGGSLPLLLALLALLVGLGAWNYHRNMAAEAQEPRPYRTLSEADLTTLIAAYESELEELAKRHEGLRQRGAPRSGRDDWSRFEAVQRHSRSVRELGGHVAEREAALEELRREQERRAEPELRRFLARLLRYAG